MMELEPMEQGLEPMEQAAARDRSPLLRPQREPEVVAGEPERRASGREAVLGARRQRQVSDLHHYKQLRRQHLSSLAQIASISHPNGRRGAEPAVRSRWGAHDGLAFVLLALALAVLFLLFCCTVAMTSSAVMTSPKSNRNVSSAAECSSSVPAAQPSDTIITS